MQLSYLFSHELLRKLPIRSVVAAQALSTVADIEKLIAITTASVPYFLPDNSYFVESVFPDNFTYYFPGQDIAISGSEL